MEVSEQSSNLTFYLSILAVLMAFSALGNLSVGSEMKSVPQHFEVDESYENGLITIYMGEDEYPGMSKRFDRASDFTCDSNADIVEVKVGNSNESFYRVYAGEEKTTECVSWDDQSVSYVEFFGFRKYFYPVGVISEGGV